MKINESKGFHAEGKLLRFSKIKVGSLAPLFRYSMGTRRQAGIPAGGGAFWPRHFLWRSNRYGTGRSCRASWEIEPRAYTPFDSLRRISGEDQSQFTYLTAALFLTHSKNCILHVQIMYFVYFLQYCGGYGKFFQSHRRKLSCHREVSYEYLVTYLRQILSLKTKTMIWKYV